MATCFFILALSSSLRNLFNITYGKFATYFLSIFISAFFCYGLFICRNSLMASYRRLYFIFQLMWWIIAWFFPLSLKISANARASFSKFVFNLPSLVNSGIVFYFIYKLKNQSDYFKNNYFKNFKSWMPVLLIIFFLFSY